MLNWNSRRKSESQTQRQARSKRLKALLRLMGTLGFVALLLNYGPAAPTVVLGASMSPTILPYDVRLLDRVYPRLSDIKRGDIVILERDGERIAKRVYALPGDTVYEIWLVREKRAILAPPDVARRFINLERRKVNLHKVYYILVQTLRPGEYYVVGDNLHSDDSRTFGPVRRKDIVGLSRPMSWKSLCAVAVEASRDACQTVKGIWALLSQ